MSDASKPQFDESAAVRYARRMTDEANAVLRIKDVPSHVRDYALAVKMASEKFLIDLGQSL